MDLNETSKRSQAIRRRYHELELTHHGSHWSVEEDTLAFLTDAGLVGRLVMAQQERWPDSSGESLESKIGECVWWLAVLAERTGLDLEECVEGFLASKERQLGLSS
ncbi:MAG: MazG-like protein [Actinomyces urogenitalis]|uniref:MazG-like protein n=1 Tax=Actinomyces urogenitalis TaxID=103621 RepID=UPI002A823899|nr:MazG-like protein [Actinomyces urogenitalis]MDY3678682.1 MazG-like protein [Actinomyces urogenitalis]